MSTVTTETKTKEKLWNSNYTKALLCNFMIFFSFMLVAPLLPIYLQERFAADKHTIGVVLSAYTIVALITRSFSGFLVDSLPRKSLLVISFCFMFLFFAGYILAGSLLLFALVRTFHGAPFGLTTVANSTVAIDVLPSSRRTEGIGYYGLSNNIATAISPSIAVWIYHSTHNFNILFGISMCVAALGMIIAASIKVPERELVRGRQPLSFDRFFLVPGWRLATNIACFGLSYGVISTYVAIYGQEALGIEGGSGYFFLILACSLILSRLTGAKSLRQGRISHNASVGAIVSLFGYLLFAIVPNEWGYFGSAAIIGLGNGHLYPAYQNMFVDLAPNSRRGTANSSMMISWDLGSGLGIVLAGFILQHSTYMSAFLMAWGFNLVGVLGFFIYAKQHFETHKLR